MHRCYIQGVRIKKFFFLQFGRLPFKDGSPYFKISRRGKEGVVTLAVSLMDELKVGAISLHRIILWPVLKKNLDSCNCLCQSSKDLIATIIALGFLLFHLIS